MADRNGVCKSSSFHMKITEQDIQKQIKEFLSLTGWFVVKNNTVGIYVKARDTYIKNPARGLPDLTAIKAGRVVMIEIKRKGNKQSPDQLYFEKNWTEHGGEYLLVYNLEEVILKLKR